MKKIKDFISDIYYKIYWTIRNCIKYFKIISDERPWSSYHILNMIEFQLKHMKNNISKYSLYDDKDESIKNIEKALLLLSSLKEDDYAERCGYINVPSKTRYVKDSNGNYKLTNPNHTSDEMLDIFQQATELKEKEWNELFDILKNNLNNWTF